MEFKSFTITTNKADSFILLTIILYLFLYKSVVTRGVVFIFSSTVLYYVIEYAFNKNLPCFRRKQLKLIEYMYILSINIENVT